MPSRNARLTLIAAYLFGLLLLIYGPIVGQGFVADDFGWVKETQPSFTQAARKAFDHADGFYPPLVNVSFAANYEVSGLSPRPYGLTNLALLFVCTALVAWLGRAAGLSPAFSLVAAGLFAFNLHGVDMSVLWVSGRTGLFLTVFSIGAAVAFVTRHHAIASLLTLCAMFSQEEAVALPIMFGLPSNAPPYYRFSADPQLLIRNAREYADRACTLSGVALMAVFACVRARPVLTRNNRVLLAQCGCWVVCGALSVPVLLVPIYRARGDRWVSAARLSTAVTSQLVKLSADPGTHAIVLQDNRTTRANLANAFGPAVSDVALLYFSRAVELRVEPSRPTNLLPGERLFVLEGPSEQLRAEVLD